LILERESEKSVGVFGLLILWTLKKKEEKCDFFV